MERTKEVRRRRLALPDAIEKEERKRQNETKRQKRTEDGSLVLELCMNLQG